MKKRVKIGKYKTVFKGQFFTIEQAPAVFPGGRKGIYERAHRTPSVTILAINDKKQLLLIREYRPTQKRYAWLLPGGRMDKPDENATTAAKRELREETKLQAKQIKLFYTTGKGHSLDWQQYFFIATSLKPDQHPLNGDEDEDISLEFTPLKQAYKMALDGEIYHDSLAYAIIKLYAERYKWLDYTKR
ncbi:NUDIX hydrolase [Patescibacteria group bacterium]|nr:NUDIX hydrolase [Patescibacteria group bacterium]